MSSPQAWKNYVPALDEVAPPPIPADPPPPVRDKSGAEVAWFAFIAVNACATLGWIVSMVIDGNAASLSVLRGLLYFALTTSAFGSILSGTVTDVVRAWFHRRVEIERIHAYADAVDKALDLRMMIEENRKIELAAQTTPADVVRRLTAVERRLLTDRMAAPAPSKNFVPAHDNRKKGAFAEETQPAHDTTAYRALMWARSLYTDTGAPDPERLWLTDNPDTNGCIRGKVIGSKRGPGSKEELFWLVQRRVLVKRPGGYALNLAMVPRAEELSYIRD